MSDPVEVLEMLRRPDWHHEAACAGRSNLMYSNRPEDQPAALALCHTCPVRPRCLADALAHQERDGIWGGFTDLERRTITTSLEKGEKLYQVVTRILSSRRRHSNP
ncbi:WhiB family transcriptional regulator [Acidiferrimicrobium sp. IK]|uniref:WhiB family transcriptional regulator n=1 Tax=Acidiferrimicrobium sp. IK TaxID=2871700 RepID=UPI0021CB5129|nr:WhiB family transcriptional regulator [Acidiferrimicrobium sp. IK]MCU4184010.1 WhiB family transcriptional regulator [Acidiferrimicrobium sp. IK]